MDIRQLRYFVTIIDSGSLSKAAEKLCVAQPALSQQMTGLEFDLKTQLLLRSSQGVRPTEAGKALYRHARAVLRQIEQAREDVRLGSVGESGQVAVGLPTSVANLLAIPLFKRIRAEYPGIHLQIFESESGYLAELLANGRLDMSVLFRNTETRGMSVQHLLDEDLFVFGDIGVPEAGARTDCPMRLLQGVPMALPSSNQGLRLLIERSFAREGLQLNVIADIDSLPTIKGAAQEGLACTILPSSSLTPHDRAHGPAIRRLVDPGIRRPVGLCWPNSLPRISAALVVHQVIVQLVVQMVNDHTWTGVTLKPQPPAAGS